MPGTTVERVSEQAKVAPTGNGPGGRKLRPGEIVPLTAAQSERLATLYAEYGSRLVGFAVWKLRNRGLLFAEARSLAEDIAQETWVLVARSRTDDLLGAEPLSESFIRGSLFAEVKSLIHQHYRRQMTGESPVDWTDPIVCNTLCPVLPGGCARAVLPAYLDVMVSALPERERAALLLRLEGLNMRIVAEHLGCSYPTANRLVETALLLLQIDNPELSGEPTPVASLVSWERRELARMSAAQQEVLLRMDETARQALLLHVGQGLNITEVARRLGVSRYQVLPVLGACASALRSLPVGELAVAA
ncbi:sigma factor-like helix-turn-helix DNA-binding protein [Streptomyces sp. NPDC001667]